MKSVSVNKMGFERILAFNCGEKEAFGDFFKVLDVLRSCDKGELAAAAKKPFSDLFVGVVVSKRLCKVKTLFLVGLL